MATTTKERGGRDRVPPREDHRFANGSEKPMAVTQVGENIIAFSGDEKDAKENERWIVLENDTPTRLDNMR